ncbi:hypothetical protein B0H14DRAFT_3535269 [Mycena olivaceomarginata]|nr:hypothetical protein B0H14DRAFT_3535269 [Mycena olivaceomarginata]
MATQTNRTYSEFFSSGLRAISGGARTSIVDLPSRLLGRMINSTDTWSLPDKADRVRRSEDNAAHSSTSYEKIRPITDPFDASPYTGSFFIDYVETPSFLLLGEPTQTKTPYLGFSLRRPRPTSIQSMPLPLSQSRRSSFQYHPMSRDKYDDRSWALEEEETPSLVWSEDAEAPHDPAASIDWHQFHNDLLHDEDA